MNKFLDDPLAIRDMNIDDVLDVVLLYDKYEFTQGTKLCEKIMLDYLELKSLKELHQAYKLDLHLVIDLTAIAHQTNMGKVFEFGIRYLLGKFRYGVRRVRQGQKSSAIMFTEEHLKKIFPLLKLLSPYDDTYELYEHELLELEDTLVQVLHRPDGINKSLTDMLNEPGVEKLLVAYYRQSENKDLIKKCISLIELSGTGQRNLDGPFIGYFSGWRRIATNDGGRLTFMIERTKKDGDEVWAIVRYPANKIYWWAPYSQNLSVPPLRGWVPCDELAKGNPTLKYILNETVE
eukprot:scaffold20986_cov42-Cyclotella_meneghiniana.AAC.1